MRVVGLGDERLLPLERPSAPPALPFREPLLASLISGLRNRASGSLLGVVADNRCLLLWRGLLRGLQESGAVVVEADFASRLLGLIGESRNLSGAVGIVLVDSERARSSCDASFGRPP